MRVVCKCTYKYRDKTGNIIGYQIQDNNGNIRDIRSDELKDLISKGKLEVENLTLTSDNRLLSKTIKNHEDAEMNLYRAYYYCDLYKDYSKLFKPYGIDIVAAVYLSYPREGDTLDDIYSRTFYRKNTGIKCAKDLIVDPTPILGIFQEHTSSDTEWKPDHRALKDCDWCRDIAVRFPMLVLHRDGGYRTVIFGEIEYSTGIVNVVSNRLAKKYKCLVTLNGDKKVEVLNIGRQVSDKENQLAAKRILSSTVALWLGEDATKDILRFVKSKDMRLRLKNAGINTLAIPLAATLAVAVFAFSILETMGHETKHFHYYSDD